MEDRDSKKAFTIPKTRVSNKDVLVPEKTDSRNFIELFDDIKSCALEVHFDFRQNECKSCETIHNQKLQKLYNERKIKMKKDQDITERFAFHLVSSRDTALNIANDGLSCEQLSFTIDKYLGNPKDGIHLSRRPDVLLASTGMHGLKKFGLLICKIILGKGYATIASANNKEFSAQLHYDHHFCKIQSSNKEQRHIDGLLANSLVYCYEHNDFETISRPSQILPLAILWYDLKEKFSPKLISKPEESLQDSDKMIKSCKLNTNKPVPKPITKSTPQSLLSLDTGTWDDLTSNTKPISDTKVVTETKISPTTPTIPNKYPSQFMLPFSSFSNLQQLTNYRDPRLARTVTSSETIPLSPQALKQEKVPLETHSPVNSVLFSKKGYLVTIPLDSTTDLTDPRLKNGHTNRKVVYLEAKALKHALQQQKRLNNYRSSNNDTKPKTSYTLIPFIFRSVSSDELKSDDKNESFITDYSPLSISVIDCFHFGLKPANDKLYVDLEENDNQLAYEQLSTSNQLIEQQKKLNSQEIRLRLRDKRQRKVQDYLNQQKKYALPNSKAYVNAGRKFFKEHKISVTPSIHKIPSEVLNFLALEYQNEQRFHMKRLLSELVGVLIEKYDIENKEIISSQPKEETVPATIPPDHTINDVIDMDLASPCSQGLGDYDERFQVQTSSLPINESIESFLLKPSSSNQNLSNETSEMLNELNSKSTEPVQPLSVNLPSSLPIISTDNIGLKVNIDSSSNENQINDNYPLSSVNDKLKQIANLNVLADNGDDSNRSREEFVKLLTKEVYTLRSPSPPKSSKHTRRSHDSDESNKNKNSLSTRTVTLVSNNYEDNLIIEARNIEEESPDKEASAKRIKITPIDETESPTKTMDSHDCRQDLDERKRQTQRNDRSIRSHSRSRSKSTSSRNSSIRESKTRSPSSSSSRASSNTNRNRRQKQNDYNYERNHSSDRSYDYNQRNTKNSDSMHSQPVRHQRFNYNHQSAIEHPRFAAISAVSAPIRSLMDDAFTTSNCTQSPMNYNQRSSTVHSDRNFNSSYDNDFSSNNEYYPQIQPLMSARPIVDFSDSYDPKPSDTIERLQMFLQNRNITSYEDEKAKINDYSSSSRTKAPSQNSNNSRWSSSRYS